MYNFINNTFLFTSSFEKKIRWQINLFSFGSNLFQLWYTLCIFFRHAFGWRVERNRTITNPDPGRMSYGNLRRVDDSDHLVLLNGVGLWTVIIGREACRLGESAGSVGRRCKDARMYEVRPEKSDHLKFVHWSRKKV